eukprot:tig00000970_g5829.t1
MSRADFLNEIQTFDRRRLRHALCSDRSQPRLSDLSATVSSRGVAKVLTKETPPQTKSIDAWLRDAASSAAPPSSKPTAPDPRFAAAGAKPEPVQQGRASSRPAPQRVVGGAAPAPVGQVPKAPADFLLEANGGFAGISPKHAGVPRQVSAPAGLASSPTGAHLRAGGAPPSRQPSLQGEAVNAARSRAMPAPEQRPASAAAAPISAPAERPALVGERIYAHGRFTFPARLPDPPRYKGVSKKYLSQRSGLPKNCGNGIVGVPPPIDPKEAAPIFRATRVAGARSVARSSSDVGSLARAAGQQARGRPVAKDDLAVQVSREPPQRSAAGPSSRGLSVGAEARSSAAPGSGRASTGGAGLAAPNAAPVVSVASRALAAEAAAAAGPDRSSSRSLPDSLASASAHAPLAEPPSPAPLARLSDPLVPPPGRRSSDPFAAPLLAPTPPLVPPTPPLAGPAAPLHGALHSAAPPLHARAPSLAPAAPLAHLGDAHCLPRIPRPACAPRARPPSPGGALRDPLRRRLRGRRAPRAPARPFAGTARAFGAEGTPLAGSAPPLRFHHEHHHHAPHPAARPPSPPRPRSLQPSPPMPPAPPPPQPAAPGRMTRPRVSFSETAEVIRPTQAYSSSSSDDDEERATETSTTSEEDEPAPPRPAPPAQPPGAPRAPPRPPPPQQPPLHGPVLQPATGVRFRAHSPFVGEGRGAGLQAGGSLEVAVGPAQRAMGAGYSPQSPFRASPLAASLGRGPATPPAAPRRGSGRARSHAGAWAGACVRGPPGPPEGPAAGPVSDEFFWGVRERLTQRIRAAAVSDSMEDIQRLLEVIKRLDQLREAGHWGPLTRLLHEAAALP